MSGNANVERGRASGPAVSVVVPTIGRPDLVRALRSVREQQFLGTIELIVVHDGPPGVELPDGAEALADRVIRTTGRVGGSRARNIGISSAKSDLVALLDDDDEWLPDKMETQLAAMRSSREPNRTVVSGRVYFVNPGSGAESRPSPDRLIGPDESIEHYLFRRRPPSGGRPTMTTPTLLLPREMAVQTPWDESLRRHQDWDWLVRLGRQPGTTFVQTADPVARIHLGSALSISASTDWEASLRWADRMLRDDPSIYVDFVVAQPLRYALAARSWAGVRTVLGAIRSAKRLPTSGPVVIGVAGVLPRRAIERATVATASKR